MNHHIPTYARFQWINHALIRTILTPLFPYAGTGRRGYDKVTLFLWLMYKQLHGCSYRDLESMSCIEHTTFIKFRNRHKQRLPQLFEILAARVIEQIRILDLIVDSSFVRSYSGHAESGSGYSGYKQAHGYKTHEIIDFSTRLPLFQIVSAGNTADISAGEQLLTRAPPGIPVRSFAADKGYDSEGFVHRIRMRWKRVRVAIPVRRKQGDDGRNRASRAKERTANPTLYKRRTEIERHYSRKKGVFRFGEERTRGLENFRANAFFVSCMQILEWLCMHETAMA